MKDIAKSQIVIIILFIITVGCKKENDNRPDLSKIMDVVGKYNGDYNNENNWGLYNPTITKYNDNTLLIDYWPSGPDSIFLKIDGAKLSIEEQIFNLEAHSLGQGHMYYYKIKLSANGSFENGGINMLFVEEMKKESDSVFEHKASGTINLIKQ
jgi:hypothetical protein